MQIRLSVAFLGVLLSGVAVGCRTADQKYAWLMDRGKRNFEKKDYARAVLDFKSAAGIRPRDAEAHYQLAISYLGSQDFPHAIAALNKATELNPRHSAAQVKLAELMASARTPSVIQDAEKRLKQVLADFPDDADALSALAMAEWRLGRPQDAEAHLAEAFQKAPQNLKAAFDLVRLKLSENDIPAAEATMNKALAANPQSTDVLFAFAQFYVLAGRSPEAEQKFRAVLELDPQNGPALVGYGALLAALKRPGEAEQMYRRASALSQPQYKPVHALYLFRTGKRDDAIKELEDIARKDPTDRTARTRLIAAYHDVGRTADAEKLWREALQKNRKDIGALLERSRFYLGTGELVKAEADLAAVIRLEPGSAEAHYLLASVHGRRNAVLLQKQELAEAVRLRPDFLPGRIELATLLIQGKGARAALDLLNETPARQKNRLSVVVYRGWAELALGDHAPARRDVNIALATARVREVLLLDATLKLNTHDPSGARKSAEEALRQNPEDVAALDLVAQSYAAEQKTGSGIAAVRRQVAARPNSAPLQHYFGNVLLKTGDRSGARSAFQASAAADPGFTPAQLDLARLDIVDGKTGDARVPLLAVLQRNPDEVRAHLLLGSLEEREGKYSEALQEYRKALQADPQNATALNNVAYLRLEFDNNPDEALQLAQRAAEIAPNDPSIQDTIGWTFYRKGLYSRAAPLLEDAAKGLPTGTVRFHLAVVYLELGDVVRGRQILAEAMKADPALARSESVKRILANVLR